jgi:hypothetical protein
MATLSLRLPEELYNVLKELAEKEQRSLNGQILYILKNYIEQLQKAEKSKQG